MQKRPPRFVGRVDTENTCDQGGGIPSGNSCNFGCEPGKSLGRDSTWHRSPPNLESNIKVIGVEREPGVQADGEVCWLASVGWLRFYSVGELGIWPTQSGYHTTIVSVTV